MKIEEVWQEYRHSLKRLLRSKISNPDDVEDLLQEILIKTHQQMASLRSRDKLKPWLFRIANNTVIDFYRKRGDEELQHEDLWYGENGIDVQQQMSECIIPFIEALPPAAAELLKAIDIEGQSQKEYAAKVGIGYSALKSRVQRGRSELRNLFEDCCHLELDRKGNLLGYQPRSKSCGRC